MGLRYVHTDEDVVTYTAAGAAQPGAITTSAFGSFYKNEVKNDYNDTLPSAAWGLAT